MVQDIQMIFHDLMGTIVEPSIAAAQMLHGHESLLCQSAVYDHQLTALFFPIPQPSIPTDPLLQPISISPRKIE